MDYKIRSTEQILKAVFLSMLMVLALSNFADAKVSGAVCSTCHTMHNSQNGTHMRLGFPPIGSVGSDCLDCHAETRAVLLRMDCLGCHAQSLSGADNIAPVGTIPQVAHNAATDLAGGNYRYVAYIDDTRGHNVHGFGSLIGADSNIIGNDNPPGYKSDYDPSSGKFQQTMPGTDNNLMCAGRNGCHGNRDQVSQMLAIKGSHHANDSILKFGAGFTETGQGSTVGTSYRFLYKVHGAEDANWEGVTPGPTVHNEYKGAPFSDRQTQAWNDVSTISDLCAECHGKFHAGGSIVGVNGIGSASPWLRHPTDVVLPASGEYTAYTAYSTEAPVARQNIADGTTQASGTVTPGADIVMCLSCHRAHASQYSDALRWDYSNMSAGRGCYICHSQKDDNL